MHGLLGKAALLLWMCSALASLGTHRTTEKQRASLLKARRTLGLMAFVAALVHALASLVHLHATSWVSVWNRLLALGFLQHGALALLVLASLALTSFPKLNARLGLRTWKPLHLLSYVALLLAALHAIEGPSMDARLGIAALGIALAIAALRVWLGVRKLATKTGTKKEE